MGSGRCTSIASCSPASISESTSCMIDRGTVTQVPGLNCYRCPRLLRLAFPHGKCEAILWGYAARLGGPAAMVLLSVTIAKTAPIRNRAATSPGRWPISPRSVKAWIAMIAA